MIDIDNLTIKDLHEIYVSGQATVKEVIDLFGERIDKKNKEINAYIEVFTDLDDQIKKAQQMIDSGQANFLTGVPVAIKDNMLYMGHHVSAGSKILEGYTAPYSSPVVLKLIESGSIIMGRTNMDEFAMGSSTETSAYGNTLNPVDINRVPGGSSGGSAAAVAMGGALLAIGSDTGGSIRQPAAFCGIVGMKPTYGMVSRYGLIAMASSLDQIGPFTKNCVDAEIAFNVINFSEPHDLTLIPEIERQNLKKKLGKKIGIPRDFIKEGVDSDVSSAFNNTIDSLKKIGYEIVDIDLPLTPLSLAVYYILMPAEVSSNLARFDGIRYGSLPKELKADSITDFYKKVRTSLFGGEVRRRSILGAFILSHGYYDAYYNKARKLQMAITREFGKAFNDVDAILLPTTPTTAFKIGERSESPLSMYLADLFTAPANIAGLPAISVPIKSETLPVGIQIITPKGNDEYLFTIGRDIEGLV
jgi:aspartyl-tRNA(Asn)/glutamyl-tRNA(Gln) amidotransferase subunit A